jgi:hypothetical protein
MLLVIGAAFLALAWMYPVPFIVELIIGLGSSAIGAAVVWLLVERAVLRGALREGHHPGMQFEIGDGSTLVATTNPALVDELLVQYPRARIERAGALAEARVLKLPGA